MIKTIHMFAEYSPQVSGVWQHHKDFDGARMATMARMSWEANGWRVVIYNTRKTVIQKMKTGLFNGIPESFIKRWYEMLTTVSAVGPSLFCDADMFCRSYTPEDFHEDLKMCPFDRADCINFMSTFCTGLLFMRERYIVRAIETLYAYGDGELKPGRQHYDTITDETILREHGPVFSTLPRCRFAYAESGWHDSPLVHVARLGLQWWPNGGPQ